jgi:hypothetical protein
MQIPGDPNEPKDEVSPGLSQETEAPTEALRPITLPEDSHSEAATELLASPANPLGEITHLPPPQTPKSEATPAKLVIQVDRQSLAQEFWGFIVHNKAWWMTPIILVLALMVAFILFAETSPVLPFIYTVI